MLIMKIVNKFIHCKIKSVKYIIYIFLILPVKVSGSFDLIQNGFGLDIGKSGSGFFLIRQYTHNSEKFSLITELRFYDIKGENEMFVYDYYTQQYRSIGSKNLIYIPAFAGLNYFPFAGKIANNFSPFLTMRSGPVLSIDGKETGSFSDRWGNSDTNFSFGSFLGVGIEFKWVNLSSVLLHIGYEYLPPSKSMNEPEDYSGLLIHIAFNRSVK